MSLVSEALKKAQRDAALRDARAKGLPEPLVAGAQPFRSRRGRGGLLVWALAGALALVLVLAIVLFIGRPQALSSTGIPPSPEAEPPRNAEKAPLKGERGPADAPEAATLESAPAPGLDAGETAPTTAPRVRELATSPLPPAPTAPPPAGVTPVPAPLPMEASGRTSTGVVPRTRSSVAPAGKTDDPGASATSFVRTAKLADGVEIRLGGIAWSEVTPLAYLNGRLLGVGETVGAWRVARIERDRVRLERGGEQVTLSLR